MNKQQMLDMLQKRVERRDFGACDLGGGSCVVGVECKFERDVPQPFSIIFDHGMTAVVWDDGTVTKTHLCEGDTFDPLFGIMACTVRKLTHNRGHGVDECEGCIREFADAIRKPGDIGRLIDFNLLMLDMLTVLDDSAQLWQEQLGERPKVERPKAAIGDCETCAGHAESRAVDAKRPNSPELDERLESMRRHNDMLRQEIRNLIDAGEL